MDGLSSSATPDAVVPAVSPEIPLVVAGGAPAATPTVESPPSTANFASDANPPALTENRSEPTAKPSPSPTQPQKGIQYADFEDGINHLPPYARSLLKIRVPVSVMLAESKQTIDNVMNIGPGSILHFSKSCEDTLALEVAGHKIAVGETVKIGDKFGLWITSIILPDERFWVIGHQNQKRAK